jgi:hypothetical protein
VIVLLYVPAHVLVLLYQITTFTVAVPQASVAVGAVKLGDAGQFMVAATPGAVTHVGAVTS